MITIKQAEDFANTFSAYREAIVANDDDGIIVWGSILIKDIDATGIYANRREAVVRLVEAAKKVKRLAA